MINQLTYAYNLIKKNGFCKRAYENPTGQMCIVGAINAYHHQSQSERADLIEILELLAEACLITEWNDAPERTKQEVLNLLAQAESLIMSEEANV